MTTKRDFDMKALLSAFANSPELEEALIRRLDEQFEAAKAAGTLPDNSAAFGRFMRQLESKAERVAVVMRRYMMVSGHQVPSLAKQFGVSTRFVEHLIGRHTPFVLEDLDAFAVAVAKRFGEDPSAVTLLLKEAAAYQAARTSKRPLLLAARPRRPT